MFTLYNIEAQYMQSSIWHTFSNFIVVICILILSLRNVVVQCMCNTYVSYVCGSGLKHRQHKGSHNVSSSRFSSVHPGKCLKLGHD